MFIEGLPETGGLHDARRVGEDDPALAQGLRRMGNHLPGFGKVEQHPVEVRLVDSPVGVADLHVVAVEFLGTEHRLHVPERPLCEVLPDLVADDLRPCPEEGHRERTRPHTRLQHAHSRPDVGQHQDRAEVLRIDHLGAPGHLEYEVAEGGPERHEGAPPTRPQSTAVG